MSRQPTNWLSTVQIQLAIIGIATFLYKTSASMFDTLVGPFLLRTVCEKIFLKNITVCDQLEHLPKFENEVQEEAGFYFITYRLFLNVPVIFSGLYFGAWSDRRGRKIPMLVPSIGILLTAMCYIWSMYMGPIAIWIALLGTLPQSVFGNTVVASMAVHSYVASVSDNNQRTRYISIFDGISALGQAFGAVLAGLLNWDLLISFCVVIGFQVLTAVLIAAFMREIKFSIINDNNEFKSESSIKDEERPTIFKKIKSYIELLKENGTGSFRSVAFGYLILAFTYGCDTHGVDDIYLMYVTARPFSWKKSWYPYYVFVRNVAWGISLLLVLPLLSHILKLSDFTIIIIGLLCNILRYVGSALSNKSWMIYALLTVWSLALLTRSCSWSVLSKTVHENQLGKMYINFAITDTLSRCIGSLVYVYIYSSTVEICPSIVFYVMGGVNVLIVVVLLTKECLLKKRKFCIKRTDKSEDSIAREYGEPEQNQCAIRQASITLKETKSQRIHNEMCNSKSGTNEEKPSLSEKDHLSKSLEFSKHKYSSN